MTWCVPGDGLVAGQRVAAGSVSRCRIRGGKRDVEGLVQPAGLVGGWGGLAEDAGGAGEGAHVQALQLSARPGPGGGGAGLDDLNRPGSARGWGSGHLAPLGDGVSIHDFAFYGSHVVD